MLQIDLGPLAGYLSADLQLEDLLLPLLVCLVASIAIYNLLKRIPVISHIMSVFIVGFIIFTVFLIPLFMLFDFLELLLIKQYILLIISFIFSFLFALFNSRSVLKCFNESRARKKAARYQNK